MSPLAVGTILTMKTGTRSLLIDEGSGHNVVITNSTLPPYVAPWSARRQPKMADKIVGKKLESGRWLVICPCCDLDWDLEDGKLALQVQGKHADAHANPMGALR